MPTVSEIIAASSADLANLSGHRFIDVELRRPPSVEAALNLSRIVSKLSPLIGNLIEFNTVEYLNRQATFADFGTWRRQDPGFPDTIFSGTITPEPGFEIKAWLPLATEITARFKDSQNRFADDNIYVVFLAWLPEFVIYGEPVILDVCIASGLSVAQARDNHYFDPPYYLITEPGDTTARTANLQQSNTSGYVWQGTDAQFVEAEAIVQAWGADGHLYRPTTEVQDRIQALLSRFRYRLDTNYAKVDRIKHPGLEVFKRRVSTMRYQGKPIIEWARALVPPKDKLLEEALTDARKAATVEQMNDRSRAALSQLLALTAEASNTPSPPAA